MRQFLKCFAALAVLANSALHDTSRKIPGGGLLSTAPDLVRFAVAVNAGELLHDDTRQQMWTSQKTADEKQTGYGLGWRVGRHSGRKTVSHTGGQSGTSTVMLLVPETGVAVAIMCNLQNARLVELASAITDVVQPPATATDYTAAIENLKSAAPHRSGLVRESPVGNYFDPDEPTLAATIASLNSTSLVDKPETKTTYSNAAMRSSARLATNGMNSVPRSFKDH